MTNPHSGKGLRQGKFSSKGVTDFTPACGAARKDTSPDSVHSDKVNGPRSFHDMLQRISQQQRYLDISREGAEEAPEQGMLLNEDHPRYRVRGKQPPSQDQEQPLQHLEIFQPSNLTPSLRDGPRSSQDSREDGCRARQLLPEEGRSSREHQIQGVSEWTLAEVNDYTNYTKWVIEHVTKAKTQSFGVKMVVACLHRLMVLDPQGLSRDKKVNGSKEMCPSTAKPAASSSATVIDPSSQQDQEDQEADQWMDWSRMEETELEIEECKSEEH